MRCLNDQKSNLQFNEKRTAPENKSKRIKQQTSGHLRKSIRFL